MTTGQKLVRRRLELNLRQSDIAERLGVHPSVVSVYERDVRQPKYTTLQKFATALECDITDLIGSDTENEEPAPHPYISPKGRLNAAVEKMNTEGIKKTADYAEDLVENPKYQKSSTPAPSDPET
ncbi:MAG: helix-turn-helix domain-containing protein [Clostridiales bacterium]|nr:helix-turn-helix domain-containing protein [Clostridiales bacterium]